MNRTGTSPETRDLAQRLLGYEAAERPSETEMPAAFYVCEKLRHPLSTVAGATGFRSLLVRALTLAKREAQVLDAVQVKDDGSLQGLGDIPNGEAAEGGAVLIAQLIGLLLTFIGETLTLRLLQDVWPDLPDLDISPPRNQQT